MPTELQEISVCSPSNVNQVVSIYQSPFFGIAILDPHPCQESSLRALPLWGWAFGFLSQWPPGQERRQETCTALGWTNFPRPSATKNGWKRHGAPWLRRAICQLTWIRRPSTDITSPKPMERLLSIGPLMNPKYCGWTNAAT